MALVTLKSSDYANVLDSLDEDTWVVVCFCAGWCNACRGYRLELDTLAVSLPDVRFFWVDIEEHGDMLGDLDVDKFPTILIQRGNMVVFYSCIHPDAKLTGRILQSMMAENPETLYQQAKSNEERRQWQTDCNFRMLLQNGLDAAG